jgi:hypothetical protein
MEALTVIVALQVVPLATSTQPIYTELSLPLVLDVITLWPLGIEAPFTPPSLIDTEAVDL